MNGDTDEVGGENSAMEEAKEKLVYMWGYLPGALPQRSPILNPVLVTLPPAVGSSWRDVGGGGCGFAMAISESGKLITWGSADDLGQSYVASGKHGETPEPFPLPTDAHIVKAAAGWAHCIAVTDSGEVYTWGWKECVPSGITFGDPSIRGGPEGGVPERQSSMSRVQGSSCSPSSKSIGGTASSWTGSEEGSKRRRLSSTKQAAETSSSGEDTFVAFPCLVSLSPGARIVRVAAGGRHTLALSDVGQVWGWGYGGEGQLGLGSRIRMVSAPHPVPCIDSSLIHGRSTALRSGSIDSVGQGCRYPGSYVKDIACGGRHSAAITDAGVLLTFGWGLYGQCGQGSSDDELSPIPVSSLLGIEMDRVSAGLWHTVCTSADGAVYTFGGNQFGQLGTGDDQAETTPRLLDSPSLQDVHVSTVSCGARHTAAVSDDGKVFCWGWNKYGQLGLGDVVDRKVPTQVPLDGVVSKNVACGWWHTLLLAEPPA